CNARRARAHTGHSVVEGAQMTCQRTIPRFSGVPKPKRAEIARVQNGRAQVLRDRQSSELLPKSSYSGNVRLHKLGRVDSAPPDAVSRADEFTAERPWRP